MRNCRTVNSPEEQQALWLQGFGSGLVALPSGKSDMFAKRLSPQAFAEQYLMEWKYFPSLAKLYDHLYEMKCRGALGCEAYADLSRDVTIRGQFTGRHDKNGPMFSPDQELKAGTTVRIVMVSRMGDVGWTASLGTETGYDCRTALNSDLLVNCRLER